MKKLQAVICVVAIITLAGILLLNLCYAQEAEAFPINGRVLMPDGSPAIGASVEARSYVSETGWNIEATATAGADGKFAIQLAKGEYRICAVSGNFLYFNRAEMINVAADGSLTKPIEIRLEKGCKVEGSVIDISTGQRVGGVKIITRDGDSSMTSDSGKWSMVLGRHTHTIIAMKDGYWWPVVNFNASGDTVNVKIETKPGGTIKGRVVNEQGQPLANAEIRTPACAKFAGLAAKTDTMGNFVLKGQDAGSKSLISAYADEYNPIRDQSVIFPTGKYETQVELVLKKTPVRTISGRVTRPDKSPVEGATVAYGPGPNWDTYINTKTDKDGKYALNKAGMNSSIIAVSGPGLAPACKQVEADKDVHADFEIKPAHSIEGRVEDEDGNPLVGVHLSASMEAKGNENCDDMYGPIANAGTDKDGKFKLENLPEGLVYVDVIARDCDNLENERLKVDRKDYTLVLRKHVQGQICGTVIKDSDGKPVPEFNARLDFSRNGGRSSSGLAPGLVEEGVNFQSADGRFNIKGLTVKEGFAVVITAPGYMQARIDPVIVKPVSEESYKDIVVKLYPAGSFEGIVTEAGTKKPIEGVVVTAWNTAGYGSGGSFNWEMSGTLLKSVSTRTDANGRFQFNPMPFALGMIQLEKQGFARTLLKNIKFAGRLPVSLEKGAAITGSITNEQGKVPPGTYINIDHNDMNVRFKASVDANGSFTINDLPPGEYYAGQHKDGRATRYQVFDLKAGETFHVDWIQRGEVTVEGRVLQHGKPVPKAKININKRDRGMSWAGSAETGEDGIYKITLLKPGNYFISCTLGEWTDPNNIHSGKSLQLKAGKNRLDFNLSCGSILGKLVDRLTSAPMPNVRIRMYIQETYEQNMGRAYLGWNDAEPFWWPGNETTTDGKGGFSVKNLKAGKWMVCAEIGSGQIYSIPGAVVNLGNGEAKSGVIAKIPPVGSAAFNIAGMKGLPKDAMITCFDDNGKAYSPEYKDGAFSMNIPNLPAGKMKALVISNEYLPAQAQFQVRPDKTTNVTIKLLKGPKIIFRPKPEPSAGAGSAYVAFKITDPKGKPVWKSSNGLSWGNILQSDGPDSPASIIIKPGTYIIKASVRADRDSWGDESDLTGWSGTVEVVSGKDTIVEIPWDK